jgi:hypothetical protein
LERGRRSLRSCRSTRALGIGSIGWFYIAAGLALTVACRGTLRRATASTQAARVSMRNWQPARIGY